MVASSLRSISPSPHTTRDPAPYGFYDARLPTSRSRSTAATSIEDDDALEVLAAPISLRVDHHLEDDLDNFLSLDLESMQHQARRGGRASYDSCSSGPHPRRSFNGAAGGCGGGAGNGSGSFGDDLPGAKARKILGITAGFDLGFDDEDDNVNGDGLDEIHAQQQGRIGRRRRNSTSTTTNFAPNNAAGATTSTRNKKRLSIVAGLARRSAGVTAPKNKSLHLNGHVGGGASARSDDESFAGGRQNWPSALRSNNSAAAAAANSIGRPGSRESSHSSSNSSSSSAAISSSTISSTLLRPRNTLAATAGVVAAQTEDEASSGTAATAATNAASSYKRDRDPVVASSKVTAAAAAGSAPMVSLSLKSPLSPLPPPSCDWTPPSNWLSRSPSNHSQSSLALPTTPSLPRTSAEGFLFARTSSDISMPMTPTSSSGGASGGGGSGKKSSARFDAYLKRLRAPRGSHSSASTTEGATSEDVFIMPGFPKTPSSSIPPPLPSPSSVSLRDLMLWEKSLETSQKNAQWQSMVEHRPRLHRQRPISSSNASSHSSLEYGARGAGGAPSLMTSGSASASASASTLNLFENESLLLQHGGWASSEEHHGGGGGDVVVDLRSSADYERRGSLAPYPFCASHREDEAFELLDERVGLAAATTTATVTASTTPTGDEAKAFPVRPTLNTSKSMPVGLGIQGEEERKTGRSNSVDDHAVALHPFKSWDVTGDGAEVAKRARGRSVDAPVQDIKTPPPLSSGTPALVLSPRRGAVSSRRSRLGAAAGGAVPRPPPQAPLLEHHLLPPPAVPAGQVTPAAPAAPAAKAPALVDNEEDETAPLFDSASEALLLELEAEIRYASTASVPLDSADDRFGPDYFGEEQDDYERWLATASAHGQPRKAPAPPQYQQQQGQSVHDWPPRRPSWAGSDVVSSAKSKRMSALEAWAEERRGSTTSTTSSMVSADGGGNGIKRGDDGLLIILPPTSSYGDVEKAVKVGGTGRLRVPV